MRNLTIVGAQFGDEGKGKIIDFLSSYFDIGVRFNGGENAGHTVVNSGKQVKFHLIPASFFGVKTLVLANGVVLNLEKLYSEIRELSTISKFPDLFISKLAHIVTPAHFKRDSLLEGVRGKSQIGTTLKGIGPAYESKYGRYGIRIIDLLQDDVYEKFNLLSQIYNIQISKEEIEKIIGIAREFSGNLIDTADFLLENIERGKKILFEAAQGTFIDIEFGTYPYVTSSHTISGGVTVGTGLPPKYIDKVMGVAKSYITRVGEGYFPTEIFGNEAEELRKLGWEYGATTGRPRRVGYFDIPMLRKSAKLNGFDYIALTKVDVLGKFKKIKLAISYEVNGSEVKEYDPLLKVDKVNYEEFKPWDDNPNNLEKFIDFIESEIKIPIPIVGNGEDRDKIIVREKIY